MLSVLGVGGVRGGWSPCALVLVFGWVELHGCVGPDLEDGTLGGVLVCVWVVEYVALGWLGLYLVGLLCVLDLWVLSLHLGYHLAEVYHLLFELAHSFVHHGVCLVCGVDDFVFA